MDHRLFRCLRARLTNRQQAVRFQTIYSMQIFFIDFFLTIFFNSIIDKIAFNIYASFTMKLFLESSSKQISFWTVGLI